MSDEDLHDACAREPIHLLGRVQSHGALLALSSDWRIGHVSTNVDTLLGRPPHEILGLDAADVLGDAFMHQVRNRAHYVLLHKGVERLSRQAIRPNDGEWDVTVHGREGGKGYIIEFERSTSDAEEDPAHLVKVALPRLRAAKDLRRFCRDAARLLQLTTGFQRVMVYRFLPDATGEVFAEALKGPGEPYLGLRYPAGDIPPQARQLYLRKTIRCIADSSDLGVAIVPPADADASPLDLSMACLRSVSPVHLQYLRNMGVAASMSVSIVVDGALWGMFACHHDAPMVLGSSQRDAAQLFGEVFSLMLGSRIEAENRAMEGRVAQLAETFLARAPDGADLPTTLKPLLEELCDAFGAQGAAGMVGDAAWHLGHVPPADELARLRQALNRQSAGQVVATHRIASLLPESSGAVAGVLAIPVSRQPRDYVLFFRDGVAKKVRWAGNPASTVTRGPGDALSPRESFAEWAEVQEGASEHWEGSVVASARQLQVSLLEVALRLTDASDRVRKVVQERQELLIAELNHRVRNLLTLIRGIVHRSRDAANTDLDSYVAMLDTRVRALARAHDLISRRGWGGNSLQSLVTAEAATVDPSDSGGIELRGQDVWLRPEAFATLALVLHELRTNSAKHGALSRPEGGVVLEASFDPAGDLHLHWREHGGPPVSAPASRRGFGSVIIERSIPHELSGRVEIDFHRDGLHVAYVIPAQWVAEEGVAEPVEHHGEAHVPEPFDPPERVLVVEDNLVIAMETEDMLQDLGVPGVDVAASAARAEALLDSGSYDFALLDVNLGSHTSYDLARRLVAEGVPVCFATGYGEAIEVGADLASVPVLCKPYDADTFAASMQTALRRVANDSDDAGTS